MDIVVLSLLSLAGIAYFWRLVRRLAPALPAETTKGTFGVPDAILAGLLAAYSALLACSSFGKRIAITQDVIVQSGVFQILLVVIILSFLIVRGLNPARLFGLRWPAWGPGIPLALVSLAAAYPIIALALNLTARVVGPDLQQQDMLTYLQTAPPGPERLLAVVMAVIVAPVSEEFIFRGYLHGVLRNHAGRWVSLVVVSLLFAAIHANVAVLAGLFVLAVALTLVYERTGSLWAPILMHAVFNAITVTVIFLWPELVT